MADIGGYPVHNYGTDPLGRMGMEMFKSSLDWDEKQKELERKAVQEAAAQQRGAFMKTVEGGTAPQGVASKLYGSEVGGGVDRLNQQNQVTEELKRLTSVIKMNTDRQTYNEKEITSIETAQEKLIKRKLELLDAGGQGDMVTYMNDQLKAMDAKVSQLRGFDVGSSVLASDVASWKTTKQEEATKEIAALGTELKTAMGAKEPDSEAISAAGAKLQAAITISRERWKIPKENFTLESKLLGEADEAMKQTIVNKLKPKEEKTYAPTNEDKEISDSLAAKGLENTPQNRAAERMSLLKSKAAIRTSDDVSKLYEKRDTKIINDAHREAVTRTRMKFGSDVEITVENGQPKIAFKSQGEASDFYDKTFNEIKQDKRQRAVKLKLLTSDYIEDTPVPKKEVAPEKKEKVLDAVTAASILKEAGGDKNKARDIAKKRGYVF